MNFRPCIDIHNGVVKQIVGSSLTDFNETVKENFVSKKDSAYYANLYKEDHLKGGHIILLNPVGTIEYEMDCENAKKALSAYPGGLQIGGGITADNAMDFIEAGASHVIVTSYVFKDGEIQYDNLKKLVSKIGKDKLVLDLSCRKKDGSYYIVTNRWQKFTSVKVTIDVLKELSEYCDEFLVHAVDVEGKSSGIENELVTLLGNFHDIPITYAGGVRNFEDLELLKRLAGSNLDVTIGSSLDLFGGSLNYRELITWFLVNGIK